jgi:hypothetical protein
LGLLGRQRNVPYCSAGHIVMGTEGMSRLYSRSRGVDLFIGRRVAQMLHAAGLMEVQVNPLVHVYPSGHGRRLILLQFVENLRARLLAESFVDEAELEELTDELERHLEDPRTRGPSSSPICSFRCGGVSRRDPRHGIFQTVSLYPPHIRYSLFVTPLGSAPWSSVAPVRQVLPIRGEPDWAF